MSWRTLFLAFCFWGAALAGRAVELVQGPAVEAEATTAVIRWKTDVECGTRVRFGLSETQLDGRAGEGVAVAHEVRLAGLLPDKAYAFTVGTAKQVLHSGIFLTAKVGTPPQVETTPQTVTPPKAPSLLEKIKAALTGGTAGATGAKPAPPQRHAPPTAQTWARLSTLQDHFDRHGADFRASSPDDYARQAWEFLQRAKDEGLPAKRDESDSTLRVWDPKTGAFAAYNSQE
ncbi:MAG: hypothetical protein ACOYMN_24145, partial [Roseimicrobium sp.]